MENLALDLNIPSPLLSQARTRVRAGRSHTCLRAADDSTSTECAHASDLIAKRHTSPSILREGNGISRGYQNAMRWQCGSACVQRSIWMKQKEVFTQTEPGDVPRQLVLRLVGLTSITCVCESSLDPPPLPMSILIAQDECLALG